MPLTYLIASALAVASGSPAAMATKSGLPLALVTGRIDERFSERLEQLLARNPQLTYVQIESSGGLSKQAYQAAALLNDRGIELRVLGRCASACALMWAATEKRSLVEGAKIGLHSGQPVQETPVLVRGAVRRHNARRHEDVLERAGFPAALIRRGLETPHEEMLWLTSSDLEASGVVFCLVSRKPIAAHMRFAPISSSKPTLRRGAAQLRCQAS